MGGTWVHWQQPHVYREMSRYGFTKMVDSINSDTGCNYSTVTVNGETTHLNKDDEVSFTGSENLANQNNRPCIIHSSMPSPSQSKSSATLTASQVV